MLNWLFNQLENDLETIYTMIKKNEEKQKENYNILKTNQDLETDIKHIVCELNTVMMNKFKESAIEDRKRPLMGGSALYTGSNIERSILADQSLQSKYKGVSKDDKQRGSLRNDII